MPKTERRRRGPGRKPTKTARIEFRVSAELKAEFEAAAAREHETLTIFLIKAAVARARAQRAPE